VRQSQCTLVCKLYFLHSYHINRPKENVPPVTVPCTGLNSSSSSVVRKCELQPRINIASWRAGYDYGLWSYPLQSRGNDNFCFTILIDPSHTRSTVCTFSRWVPTGAYVLKLLHFFISLETDANQLTNTKLPVTADTRQNVPVTGDFLVYFWSLFQFAQFISSTFSYKHFVFLPSRVFHNDA